MTIPPPAWVVDRLAGSSRALGIELAPEACAALGEYTALVVAWGARVNLTGARTPEAFIDEQVADALALLPHLPAGRFRYVDVGTGAGLPGLVITILRAEASGVLLEPVGKKRAFVSHAVRELVISGQAEDTTDLYVRMNLVAPKLVRQKEEKSEGDYWVDDKGHQVILSEDGHEHAEALLAQAGMLPEENAEMRARGRLGGALQQRDRRLVGDTVVGIAEMREVQAGSRRLRVRADELKRKETEQSVVGNQPPAKRKGTSEESSLVTRPSFTSSPGIELDLRGMMSEDAVDKLEAYLDKAYLSGLPFVRIIHGKGTGKLRSVVRQALKEHPHVRSFEEGGEKEGGEGVTVAKMSE